MSLLRSYSYGYYNGKTELPDEALGLFVGYTNVDYASEIVDSCLNDKINYTKAFNLRGFQKKIEQNQRLGLEHRRNKELFLDFSDSGDDWEETEKAGGIKADVAAMRAIDKMEDAYARLEERDELRYALRAIKDLQKYFLVEERIDFLHTIRQALKGMPESVKVLQKVCTEYKTVGEYLKIVLSSGMSFDEALAYS